MLSCIDVIFQIIDIQSLLPSPDENVASIVTLLQYDIVRITDKTTLGITGLSGERIMTVWFSCKLCNFLLSNSILSLGLINFTDLSYGPRLAWTKLELIHVQFELISL